MGKDHKKLENNLEDLRKRAGLTQQDLSEEAEVSRKSINAIENGKFDPSLGLVFKLVDVLGKPLEEIFIND